MSTAVQHAPEFSPTAIATGDCVLRVPRHHAHFRQKFLLRVSGFAQVQDAGLCALSMLLCGAAMISPMIPGSDFEERRQKLAIWLDALHRVQQGHPTDDPILLALTDAQHRFKIPATLLDQLAQGTAMDIVEESYQAQGFQVQYKTFEELRVYCYRVASVVGLVCIRIFGYQDHESGKACRSNWDWLFSSPTSFAM